MKECFATFKRKFPELVKMSIVTAKLKRVGMQQVSFT